MLFNYSCCLSCILSGVRYSLLNFIGLVRFLLTNITLGFEIENRKVSLKKRCVAFWSLVLFRENQLYFPSNQPHHTDTFIDLLRWYMFYRLSKSHLFEVKMDSFVPPRTILMKPTSNPSMRNG